MCHFALTRWSQSESGRGVDSQLGKPIHSNMALTAVASEGLIDTSRSDIPAWKNWTRISYSDLLHCKSRHLLFGTRSSWYWRCIYVSDKYDPEARARMHFRSVKGGILFKLRDGEESRHKYHWNQEPWAREIMAAAPREGVLSTVTEFLRLMCKHIDHECSSLSSWSSCFVIWRLLITHTSIIWLYTCHGVAVTQIIHSFSGDCCRFSEFRNTGYKRSWWVIWLFPCKNAVTQRSFRNFRFLHPLDMLQTQLSQNSLNTTRTVDLTLTVSNKLGTECRNLALHDDERRIV